jgi:protein-tyrosine phosphatase
MAYLGSDNLNLVVQNLYIGDYLMSINYEALTRKSITHILICAEELSPRFPESFNYKKLMIDDDPNYPIRHYFEEAFEFISTGLKKGAVLVHCAQGRSRSVSIILMYLMRSKRLTLKKALLYLKERHKYADPNPGFLIQLKQYQKMLNIQKSFCFNSIF